MQGLLGKKLGMTQVYDDAGNRVAVTVIEAGPCVVMQRKTSARDGYEAVQLGFRERKESRATKPLRGHCRKAGAAPCYDLREFRLDGGEDAKPGDTVTAALFENAGFVDVTGITKGRGFQGVVRRFRMSGGPLTHGGHSKRRVGSIGQCSYPARVAKGQGMPGQMGRVRVTTQNLRVVRWDAEKHLLLVRGAVPGPNGTILEIRKSIKKPAKAS